MPSIMSRKEAETMKTTLSQNQLLRFNDWQETER
jgi:hypothetical protein